MFHQTFSLLDLPKVLILIFLECILSADNALIIAAIIKPLKLDKRNKALWSGVAGAIVLRILAIFTIAYFIHFFWVQVLGAIYLLYLAIAYRIKGNAREKRKFKPSLKTPFWKVVLELEFVDLIFAFDSIVAALAITGVSISAETGVSPKLWIVYLGGIIGLVVMRFAAKLLSILMDKLHNLEKASHYLIGWVGIKLGFESICTHVLSFKNPTLMLIVEIVFWIGVVALFGMGFMAKKKRS
jgi:YkoY family integral membrane protein